MTKYSVPTEASIMTLLESGEDYPVDFNEAWQWLGYSTKANGLRMLVESFEEGFDFSSIISKKPGRGRPSVSYWLTNDCFKMLGMMAGTEKGKEIRRYYIDCEKALKAKPALIAPSVDDSVSVAKAFSRIFQDVPLGQTPSEKAMLIAGVEASVVGMRHPELRGELMEYHKLLAASNPIPETLLTPTTIGSELGLSARSVNNLLIDRGLQTRVPKERRIKGEPDYRPTSEGKQYAANTLSTGNMGDRSTYQHIKWQQPVIAVLSDFLQSRAVEAIA